MKLKNIHYKLALFDCGVALQVTWINPKLKNMELYGFPNTPQLQKELGFSVYIADAKRWNSELAFAYCLIAADSLYGEQKPILTYDRFNNAESVQEWKVRFTRTMRELDVKLSAIIDQVTEVEHATN